jgi:hypothetical protein
MASGDRRNALAVACAAAVLAVAASATGQASDAIGGAAPAPTAGPGTAAARAKPGALSAAASRPYDEKRWALIIGVSRYEDLGGMLPDLQGPSNDARRISEALINHGRFDPKHVVVVADETPLPPTRDNILQQLDRVTEEIQGDDGLLVLFFAGHGVEVAGEAYLLPSNVRGVDQLGSSKFTGSAVRVSEIRQHIEESNIRHVVLLLDACRDNPANPAGRGRGIGPARNTPAFRQAFAWNNSVTIFSTQTGKEAFETGRRPSVGYFADALSAALSGRAKLAINANGEVTVASLMDYLPGAVEAKVRKELKRDQTPQIIANVGGSIALAFPSSTTSSSTSPASPEPDADASADATPESGGAASAEGMANIRLRLPDRARTRPDLKVSRNFFSIDQSALGDPVTVMPGKQFFEVQLPGYRPWSKDFDAEAGNIDVTVSLEPQRRPLWLSLGVAVVGASAVVTGLIFGQHAHTLSDEVMRACNPWTPACNFTPGAPLADKQADGQRANTIEAILLVAGGVLLAGGAAAASYFYFTRPALAAPAGFDVAIGGGSARATWSHAF